MKKEKALNWLLYVGPFKPTEGISDARWQAMARMLERELLEKYGLSDEDDEDENAER